MNINQFLESPLKNPTSREDFNPENLKKKSWPSDLVPKKGKYGAVVCDFDTLEPVSGLPTADFPIPTMESTAKGWATARSERYGERIVVLIDFDGKIHHAYYRGKEVFSTY